MIAFLATWHNGHILWIRLIQKAARRNMVFCLGQAAAICTIIVQPAVAIICFIRIHCYYNSPKSSIIQNRVQSYKKNMNYARGKCIFCAKNVKKSEIFSKTCCNKRKNEGEMQDTTPYSLRLIISAKWTMMGGDMGDMIFDYDARVALYVFFQDIFEKFYKIFAQLIFFCYLCKQNEKNNVFRLVKNRFAYPY